MEDPKQPYLPLGYAETMDHFIDAAQIYNKYKDRKILCLGRSPKWFLNASLWIKDGINDYDFIPFSGSWYKHYWGGKRYRDNENAPNETQIKTYRNYLKTLKVDPKSIIDNYKKTGKKAILTDYICTGRGMTSFLEIMGNWAKDEGCLDEYMDSFEIVAIGCRDYMEMIYDSMEIENADTTPHVEFPDFMKKYQDKVKYTFYNLPYRMFGEMLLNPNTNECRSTYYPFANWLLYKPNRFKTGMIKDVKRIEELKKHAGRKTISSFNPAMQDFRNLLNFRILDALDQKGLLKVAHRTKI